MKDYEYLSDDCKILWCENFKLNKERYTQVSGYIFNDANHLLIVRNKDVWTIPGGHPELGETPYQTLEREVMEESCLTIKQAQYMGAVEVVEGNEIYYQLRYTAKVDNILPFKEEWEISERKFVSLDELHKYIKWSNGKVFSQQINAARKIWEI